MNQNVINSDIDCRVNKCCEYDDYLREKYGKKGTKTSVGMLKEQFKKAVYDYEFDYSRPFDEDFGLSINNPIEVTSIDDEFR